MIWEKINHHSNKIALLFALILVGWGTFLVLSKPTSQQTLTVGYTSTTVKAQVLAVIEQGKVELGEISQDYQTVSVRILEGEWAGRDFIIDIGKRNILPQQNLLSPNDTILINLSELPDGSQKAHFVDFVRIQPMAILVILFILICVLVSGSKGIKSLIGVGLSLLIIIYFIIPQILEGKNPVFISLIGSLIFIMVSQFIVYGWTLKTHISLWGMVISMIITGMMALFFVDFTRLNGMGDENAMFLMQQANYMNIKNLLIAGIIIGTLGILDDIIVGQTSAVIEIYRAAPQLRLKERYLRAMNVGKDHMAAMVNTLILAYLGASLPLFLLFSTSSLTISNLINFNMIAEEIVRTLVGSIGLFLSVPITTFIASWVVDDEKRLAELVKIFGPLLNRSEISHQHS